MRLKKKKHPREKESSVTVVEVSKKRTNARTPLRPIRMPMWPFGRRHKRHETPSSSPDPEDCIHHTHNKPNNIKRKPSKRQRKTEESSADNLHVPDATTTTEDIHHSISRKPSLVRNPTSLGIVARRMSKRKAARRRDHNSTPLRPGDPNQTKRGQHLYPKNVYLSDLRNTGSSLTDITDTFAFKVNAFDLWTPRPAVQYTESLSTPVVDRSRNQSTASVQKDKQLTTIPPRANNSNNNNNRVEDLADDLGAGALRELLERDHRRKERRHIERSQERENRLKRLVAGREGQEERRDAAAGGQNVLLPQALTTTDPPGQDSSGGGGDIVRENEHPESVPANDNNVDAVRAPPPQPTAEPRMSMSTTTSPPRSLQHRINSPSTSQVFSIAQGSTSASGRSIEAERKLSAEQSSKRMNALSSLIRRGSSRIKGGSRRKRIPDQQASLDFSYGSSRESFKVYAVPPPGPIPAAAAATKSSPINAQVNHSHSKFTEHFGDEPGLLSPPDSRVQSPACNKADSEEGEEKEEEEEEAEEGDDGNEVHLSLASVDSEGSWMSGEFLRRISQPRLHAVRESVESPEAVEEKEDEEHEHQHVGSSRADGPSSNRASSTALGNENEKEEDQETWHGQIGKRPVVMSPDRRPKSAQVLLKNVDEMSPVLSEFGDGISR